MASYVGLDVSLAETSVCVLGGDGGVRFEGKVKTRPEELIECLRKHAGDAERVGMETGQTAGVLFRAMKAAELPILCLETRHAHRALSARTNKTDRNDARGLAELMRVGWYREAWVRGASAHAIRSLLLGRRLLLQTKRTLENSIHPVRATEWLDRVRGPATEVSAGALWRRSVERRCGPGRT